SQQADVFLRKVREVLGGLESHDFGSEWRFEEGRPPLPHGGRVRGRGGAPFVAPRARGPGPRRRGGPGRVWAPRGAPGRGGGKGAKAAKAAASLPPAIQGTFLMNPRPGSREKHTFNIEARLLDDSVSMISHPEDHRRFRTAFLSFSRRIVKQGREGVCLLSSL